MATLAGSTHSHARLVVGAALVAAIVGGALIATDDVPSDPYTATGTVRCASDATPVGVWMSAPFGDAGWAAIRADTGHPQVVHYARSLPHGGAYALNVGCGGTPQSWGITATSDTYREGDVHLICNDRPTRLGRVGRWFPPLDRNARGGTAYGRCARVE